MRIEVIGPFRGPSGHDRHTREFVRAMVGLGAEVQLTSVEGWSPQLPGQARDPWFEALTAPINPDIVLHFMMPDRCQPRQGKTNVNYTMFEASGIPADWVGRANDHRCIIVPTEACHKAWIGSGVPAAKVAVCPLGVDGAFFSCPAEPLPLQGPSGRPVSSYRARFLNIAELRPRKNHIGLLRTWIRATSSDDDAILILKCQSEPHLMEIFQEDLMRMQMNLGKTFAEAAPVVVLMELLGDEQMRALYRTATHYISMSNGEGWDLPMMEAAATGLRLIAPDHSGYRAYLRDGDAEFIPAVETAAKFEGRVGAEDCIFFDGVRWWHPCEDAAAEVIARTIRDGATAKTSVAERIRGEFTWEQAAKRLLEILEDVLHGRN
jgi:glycosyltransferase involved in cell wall biosynthesis